jgi:hypothetical protein
MRGRRNAAEVTAEVLAEPRQNTFDNIRALVRGDVGSRDGLLKEK